MRFLVPLLFFVTNIIGQEVLFEGHVYDAQTKAPIPFVNLSFLNTLKGTSTDENGHFFIDIPKELLANKVHISSLGYKETIKLADSIYHDKKLYLKEDSFELDEVVVSQASTGNSVLNPISTYDLTSGFSSSSTPWVLALYFPNIGQQKKYVHKIMVFFQETKGFERPSAKFRLRIYDVDPKTKKPRRDLIRKSIVLESNADEDYVSIDLSSINLKVPKEGIYIGLEWLFVPLNWYFKTEINPLTQKKQVEDRFAPTYGAVYSKNQNYKAMVYGMGEWNDFIVKSKDQTKNLIPAISLAIKTD